MGARLKSKYLLLFLLMFFEVSWGNELIRHIEFDSKNRLVETGQYYKGKQVGTWTKYKENGDIYLIRFYKNDKLHGKYYIFFGPNQNYIIRSYKDGKKHGEDILYNSDKKILRKTVYKNGYKHGEEVSYSPKTFKVTYKGFYKDHSKHGEFISYWEDTGKIQSKATYINDKVVGETFDYRKDGTLEIREVYKDGEIQAAYLYNKKGKLYRTIKGEELKKLIDLNLPRGK